MYQEDIGVGFITGQEESPVEIAPGGAVIRREDLKTTHEEADAIIVAQAIYAAKVEGKYHDTLVQCHIHSRHELVGAEV